MRQVRKETDLVVRGPAIVQPDGAVHPGAVERVEKTMTEPFALIPDAQDTAALRAHLADSALVESLEQNSADAVATVGAALTYMVRTHKTMLDVVEALGQSELAAERALVLADALGRLGASRPDLRAAIADALDAGRAQAAERLARVQAIQEACGAALEKDTADLEQIVAAFARALKEPSPC